MAAAPTSPTEIRVLITTWNVGNEEPKDFESLCKPAMLAFTKLDMLVLGLQESTYTPRQGVSKSDLGHFFDHVADYLGSGWFAIRTKSLGQMQIGVFAKNQLKPFVSDVHCAVERTGFADVVSNKGGISVRFSINGISMTFVSSHLAAHEGESYREARNADVAEIMNGTLHFGTTHLDPANHTDHTFWMGDLNYRMAHSFDPSVPAPTFDAQSAAIKALVAAENWAELQRHDELLHEISVGNVFVGFQEKPPTFLPTFKMERVPGFLPASKRIPAWCDRVLWKSLPNRADDVRVLMYEPLMHVSTSDHKPVQAIFQINLPAPAVTRAVALTKKDASTNGCIIRFHDLSISDMPRMDVASENDAYVVFLSRHLFLPKAAFATKPKKDTATPHWTEREIPAINTCFSTLDVLKDECLILGVVDSDLVKDDIIGFAVLNLKEAITKQQVPPFGPYVFDLPIVFLGRNRGHIKGSVSVVCQTASV